MSKIITFCGVDGVGKTTLIQQLQNNYGYDKISFRKKRAVHRVKTLFSTIDYNNIHLEVNDSLKEIYVQAYFNDFVAYYQKIFQRLSGNDLILSDRWFYCISAFAHCLGVDYSYIENFAESLEQVHLVVFIKAQEEVIERRINMRERNRVKEKSIDLLMLYQESYESYFSNKKNVITIENNSDQIELKELIKHF